MMQQCPGRWVLTCFNEKDQAEASFFILGSQLHETIEVAINLDLDLDQALRHVAAGLDRELERIKDATRVLESSKRGIDTMHDDAARMLRNWYKFVHPDSPKRHEIYDDYHWPPKTEAPFRVHPWGTKYPIWGSIDAIFSTAHDTGVGLIVDWKSGTSRQRDSHQLHFYQYGIGLQRSNAAFHHLDRVRKSAVIQMADPYPGDDVVRQRIIATEAIKDGILEDGHVTFNPDWYCNYCPVQQFCPEDGDVRNREANLEALTRQLKLARPMEAMPEVA